MGKPNQSLLTLPYRKPGDLEWNVKVQWKQKPHAWYGSPKDVFQNLDTVEAKEIAAVYRALDSVESVTVELNTGKYLKGYL